MVKFDLMHVLLYARGFYKRSEDILYDLHLCLTEDGYEYLTSKEDIIGIIESRVNIYCKSNDNVLRALRQEIHPSSCSRIGYYHANDFRSHKHKSIDPIQMNKPYDVDMAFLYCYLSKLRMNDINDFGLTKLITPTIKQLIKNDETD
jgi:hypothetical protein